MSYELIKLAAESLSYREKMKLASYLINVAMKEEENLNPVLRSVENSSVKTKEGPKKQKKNDDQNIVSYAKERLVKSKPTKIHALKNFIGAMFQYQGGIEEAKIEAIVKKLEKEGFLSISGTKVVYS